MMNALTIAQARLPEIQPWYLAAWMACLFLFLGLVLLILSIAAKLRAMKSAGAADTTSPLKVQEEEKLATKTELKAMEARLGAKISEVENDMAEERRVAREENGHLHGRIDELVETVAEAKGLLSGVKENTDRLLERSLK